LYNLKDEKIEIKEDENITKEIKVVKIIDYEIKQDEIIENNNNIKNESFN
jgi:hypothetical protein